MHILIVTQYFWPENFRINDLALGMLERGHQVTVLTGVPNYPSGSFFDGYGFFNKKQDYRGVKVLRVPLIPRGEGGGLRLAINYISFAFTACIAAPLLCKEKYDLIFVFQLSPITAALPAILLKEIKSVPIMFWVQDLWPDSLSATGAIRSRVVLRSVENLVKFIYKKCDRILIQSRLFFDSVVQNGCSPNDIIYFPNSAETIFEMPSSYIGELPLLPEGFKIMFAGNIGAAQDFDTIIAAAKLLQDYKDIHWIIVGNGRMRKLAETEVINQGLCHRIHFLGRYPLEAMPTFFSNADSLLVTLNKDPIFRLTIPTKTQSYLASGKPIIAAIEGEGAKVIEEAGAGFTCSSGEPDALAQTVLRMYRTPKADRDEMGKQGREYYKANFQCNMLLDKLEVLMRELIK